MLTPDGCKGRELQSGINAKSDGLHLPDSYKVVL